MSLSCRSARRLAAALPLIVGAPSLAAGQAAPAGARAPLDSLRSRERTAADSAGDLASRTPLGASVAIVRADELRIAPAAGLGTALQGKVAGAQILSTAGGPGDDATVVLLRTRAALGVARAPLVVVDGVVTDDGDAVLRGYTGEAPAGDLRAIDPELVERVEVLRGPAASALYGPRAAHGAIVVTMRRGLAGAPRVEALARAGTSALPRQLDVNLAATTPDGVPVTRIDHQDAFFRGGAVRDAALGVSGGGARVRYLVRGTWADETGIVPDASATRLGGSVALDGRLARGLELRVHGNARSWDRALVPPVVLTTLVRAPTDATLRPSTPGTYPPVRGSVFGNPYFRLGVGDAADEETRLTGGGRLTWTPTSRLRVAYGYGVDRAVRDARTAQQIPANEFFDASTEVTTDAQDSRVTTHDVSVELTSRFRRSWMLTSALGFDAVAQRASRTVRDLYDGVEGSFQSTRAESDTRGVRLRQDAEWRGRLTLGAGAWVDVSPDQHLEGSRTFPTASAAYLWRRDAGMPKMRLRAAYGEAGPLPVLSPSSFGLVPIGTPIERLRRERLREIELGADLWLWEGRATIAATVFDRRTSDLILDVLEPPSIGGGGLTPRNAADIAGRGVELTAGAVLVRRDPVRWTSTAVLSAAREEVDRLDVPPFSSGGPSGQRLVHEGGSPDVFYGTYVARDCATGAPRLDAEGRLVSSENVPEGDCNAPGIVRLGSTRPSLLAGWQNDVRLGARWRLGSSVDAAIGHEVWNGTRNLQDLSGTSAEAARLSLPAGDPARLPEDHLIARSRITAPYVEDASFVRLRELALTYTATPRLLRRVAPAGLAVTLAGRNLATWSNLEAYDAEVATAAVMSGAVGYGPGYPLARVWTLGVRVGR